MVRRGEFWWAVVSPGAARPGEAGRGRIRPATAWFGGALLWTGGLGPGEALINLERRQWVAKPALKAIGGEVPNNMAKMQIEYSEPYTVSVKIRGDADFLFHRYSPESVIEKSKAAKGSKAKKTDDVESYVYRNERGNLCIPGEYLRGAIINAAKFRQDPRSPRKSAMDLFKAGVLSLTALADLGKSKWDYEDQRRVVVQRNAVPRIRPAIKAGWTVEFQFLVNLPEYINQELLHDVIQQAGRLVGIGDFRPTYGRFQIVNFKVV